MISCLIKLTSIYAAKAFLMEQPSFYLPWHLRTLEARSLHSTTLSVISSTAVNKSDHSYMWSHRALLFKHLDL